MLPILTIAVGEIIRSCICNLKHVITLILSGTLIYANLGYLALINLECKFSYWWFILTWENEIKLYEVL